jgi:HJR/Mrr/RecB family endonuclease
VEAGIQYIPTMRERTKPLRPRPRDGAERFVGWLASKSRAWFVAVTLPGAAVATFLAIPLQLSWHEVLAWGLVGTSVPLILVAFTAATVARGRNLVAEAHSLDDIRKLSWTQFEEFVGGLFRARHWRVAPTATEGDGGADLVISQGRQRAYVQCKQWRGQVDVATVRAFYGVMAANHVKKGFFVTTGEFTPEAERFAQSVGIDLIGSAALIRYLHAIQRTAATDSGTG